MEKSTERGVFDHPALLRIFNEKGFDGLETIHDGKAVILLRKDFPDEDDFFSRIRLAKNYNAIMDHYPGVYLKRHEQATRQLASPGTAIYNGGGHITVHIV